MQNQVRSRLAIEALGIEMVIRSWQASEMVGSDVESEAISCDYILLHPLVARVLGQPHDY